MFCPVFPCTTPIIYIFKSFSGALTIPESKGLRFCQLNYKDLFFFGDGRTLSFLEFEIQVGRCFIQDLHLDIYRFSPDFEPFLRIFPLIFYDFRLFAVSFHQSMVPVDLLLKIQFVVFHY